jgi:pyruvate formate lyase activating enzyme
MEIYGLEKLSLVDFDGKVAATVFTGACNFRCGFCHNSPLVTGVKDLPELGEQFVLDYLKKRYGLLDGVCVSGGEPTLQKDLLEFCQKLKEIGYAVKLDTNGTNPTLVKTLAENGLVDHFAVDIKNDKDNYAKIIGFDKFDTKNVEKTVDYLLTGKVSYEFRTTLIKEYHAESNILAIGNWIKGAKKYFLQQFKHSDGCITQGLNGIDEQTAKKFIDLLTPTVPSAKLRGY